MVLLLKAFNLASDTILAWTCRVINLYHALSSHLQASAPFTEHEVSSCFAFAFLSVYSNLSVSFFPHNLSSVSFLLHFDGCFLEKYYVALYLRASSFTDLFLYSHLLLTISHRRLSSSGLLCFSSGKKQTSQQHKTTRCRTQFQLIPPNLYQ